MERAFPVLELPAISSLWYDSLKMRARSLHWKRWVCATAAVAAFLAFAGMPAAHAAGPRPKRQVIDYVFLIGADESMNGLPHGSGNPIILPRVKDVVKGFLADAAPGSNVLVTTFDARPGAMKTFRVRDSDDVARVQKVVDSLQTTGDESRPFAALSKAVDRMALTRRQHPSEEHVAFFFVYADSASDEAGAPAVLRKYQKQRGKKDWLFFTLLGENLKQATAGALRADRRIRYVGEKAGEIHPVLLVETRVPFLDFGNLKQSGTADRLELFGVHFRDKLPEGVQIRARARFKEVATAGGNIQLTPESLPPDERATLRLILANKEIRDGEYRGVISFTSTDRNVVVAPPSIAVRFVGEPERTVGLLPGNQPWPLDLGKIGVWGQDEPVDTTCSIVMQYNERAVERGGTLQVRIEPDPQNLAALGPGRNFRINTTPTMSALVKPPAKSIEVVFRAARDLTPATYRGVLVFSSNDMTVSGVGLNPDPRYPGGLVLPWSFTVPKAPWPAWVRYGLMALGILAVPVGILFGLAAFRGESVPDMVAAWMLSAGMARPVLQDAMLEILEPKERRGTEYDLKGKEVVALGKGGEYFPDADGRVELSAVMEGQPKGLALRLKVVSGEAFLKRAQERKEIPVEDETRLYDGDILRLGRYKARLNSFTLQRD